MRMRPRYKNNVSIFASVQIAEDIFVRGFESHHLHCLKKQNIGSEKYNMNYYEKELLRMRRNFDFSMKIYEGRPLEQKTLCLQMKEKVEHFRIPKNFAILYRDRQQLAYYIQDAYFGVQIQENAGKYGKPNKTLRN